MSNCLACTDPIAPCNCTATQTCLLTVRTCTTCNVAFCVDKASSNPTSPSTVAASPSSSSSSSNVGTTAGAAAGGVLAILAFVALAYFCWWKPRGLAASRKRYSAHLSAKRQSKAMMMTMAPTAEEKRAAIPLRRGSDYVGDPPVAVAAAAAHPTTATDLMGDRSARSDSMETERPLPPGSEHYAGHEPEGSALIDDPFADHARYSVHSSISGHTSDYSFRSSQSTNIIPIAYMPPHSNSMSVEDSLRGPLGELEVGMSGNRWSRGNLMVGGPGGGGVRSSIPMSIESRDSLDDHYADVQGLPNALSPHSSYGARIGPVPARPPRQPGLDLKLPTTYAHASSSSSSEVEELRPTSGFPWNRPPLVSTFSTSSPLSPDGRLLPVSSSNMGSNGRRLRPVSSFSTLSASTSRTDHSTLSYILDPPQIITPSNAQGLRRVEVMGSRQAGLVTLPGSSSSSSNPSTPNFVVTMPASDSTVALEHDEETGDDPFADPGASLAMGAGAATSSTATAAVAAFVSNTARWTSSTEGGEGEYIDIGISPARSSNDYRHSAASTTTIGSDARDSISLLDGIPFVAPTSISPTAARLVINTTALIAGAAPLSSPFPLPPLRSPTLNSPLSPGGHSLLASSSPSSTKAAYGRMDHVRDIDNSSPLPAPFLPFAGQRPTTAFPAAARSTPAPSTSHPLQPSSDHSTVSSSSSSLHARATKEAANASRQEDAMSIRSSMGASGLDHIPFQLWFPGRMSSSSSMTTGSFDARGGGARDSVISVASGRDGTPLFQHSSTSLTLSDSSFVTARQEMGRSKMTSEGSAGVAGGDPFGKSAEVFESESESDGVRVRVSLDELAFSARMARSFTGDE